MAREAQFSLGISALDRFSRVFTSFGNAVNNQTARIQRLSDAMGRLSARLGSSMGFPRMKTALGDAGKAFGKVRSSAMGFATNLAIIGAAAGAAGAAIYKLIRLYTDAGDEAVKYAQKAGISSAAWQEMSYAALLSDVNNEQLVGGYQKLNKAMVAAAKGGKTQAEVFQRLGITLKTSDGLLKATDTVMVEVAEAFSKMPSGALKTAAAMELFGKSGAALLPLLNSGEEGLKDLRREAVELGLVFEEDAAAKGEAFNDSVTVLSTRLKGLGLIIGERMLPVGEKFVKLLSSLIDENRAWVRIKAAEWADKLSKAIPRIRMALQDAMVWFRNSVDWTLNLINKWGGFTSVIKKAAVILSGPLLLAIGGLMAPLAKLSIAMLTTPIGWIAIAAIGLGLLLARMGAFGPLMEGFKEGFGSISDVIAGAQASWEGLNGSMGEIDWKETGRVIGEFVNVALGALIVSLQAVVKLVDMVVESLVFWQELFSDIGSSMSAPSPEEARTRLEFYKNKPPGERNPEIIKYLSDIAEESPESYESSHIPSEEELLQKYREEEAAKEAAKPKTVQMYLPMNGEDLLKSAPYIYNMGAGAKQSPDSVITEKQDITINIKASSGLFVEGVSGSLPENVHVNNGPSKIGVENNG
jgi:hypothetical protein